jgi:UDP-GlcNAc:undecaprenyl-phosphate/decaprenyl-phosphate GlcNAc-1-phosphate transferase
MGNAIPGLANSAILSLLLINALRSYAGKLNLLDRPGGRKRHQGAVPTVGGICIYSAFLLALMLDPHLLAFSAVPIANMGLLVCVGALDDAVEVSPAKKLIVETIAAVALVAVTGSPVSDIMPELDAVIGAGFAIVMILCVINAVNMADGVDGLAGWLITVALLWLMIGALLAGASNIGEVALRLCVPVGAFLAFNSRAPWRPVAAVFMGDAGTLMLGYAISWLCLELVHAGIPVIASSLVIAVPVSDTISLFFRRLCSGRSPFLADRSHMHHLLEEAGLAPGAISLVLASVSAAIGGIGILGGYAGLSPRAFLLVWIAVLAGHCAAVQLLRRRAGIVHLRLAAGEAK